MNYNCRRWISLFLTVVLIISGLSADFYAAVRNTQEQSEFTDAKSYVHELPASRLDDASGKEVVYFGTATADLSEEEKTYSLPVYREGNLEAEASVSLLTLDISALYGRDYELCAEEVFVAGNEETLLRKNSAVNQIMSDEEALGIAAELEEQAVGEDADANGEETGKSEEENGEIAEENSETGEDTENEGDTVTPGAITSSLISDLLGEDLSEAEAEDQTAVFSADSLDFSAGIVLHFAKGEDEKIITFRILEDEEEEGQEMFQFVLADAEETSTGTQATFVAVINDNEELHDALLSFSQESYVSEEGQVTVTVNRTGSLYSLIDFTLRSVGDSAVAGENYVEFSELLSMQPWQTSLEYTFAVTGEGRMEVMLIPETGCVLSGGDTAEVIIDAYTWQEAEMLTEEEEELLGLEEGESAFKITIDDKKYTVRYSGSGKTVTKGGIYNTEDYPQDAPKVGDYYFATPKNCSYDQYTGDSAHRESSYVENEKAEEACGHLYWYSGWVWRKGSSYLNTTCDIPSTYYSRILPDWEGLHYACGYQTQEFEVYRKGLFNRLKKSDLTYKKLYAGSSHSAEFSRRIDSRVEVKLPYYFENMMLAIRTDARDDITTATPKVGLNVYGFACLYKSYDVKTTQGGQLTYRTGQGGELESLPFQLKLESGVKSIYSSDVYHMVYTDSEEKQSILTFSTGDVRLNGHTGKYGEIEGYTVTYNCDSNSDEQRTLEYPEDFFAYMTEKNKEYREQQSETESGNLSTITGTSFIDYGDTAVAERKKAASSSYLTVVFDRYLIDWLQSVGREIYGDMETLGKEAVRLSFEPRTSYTEVKVHVLEPASGSASFSDPDLTVTTDTQPHSYHAGDTLNLSAVAGNASQRVIGYEVSYNGNEFDIVKTSQELFLDRGHTTVWVRPLVTTENNRIEIRYIGDAAQHVSVAGLIDPSELEGTVYEGKHIYAADPKKSGAIKKATPTVGEEYDLLITVGDTDDKDYVYRPYILDPVNGTVNTQIYPVIARANYADNVISIGVEKVRKTELREISLSGVLQIKQTFSKMWDTAEAKTGKPVSGYNVLAFTCQGKDQYGNTELRREQATTDVDGIWKINGVLAKEGDRLPLLVSGAADDDQLVVVKVGADEEAEAGICEISYPFNAPMVSSLMYSYKNMVHNTAEALSQNTVKIYDDILNFQITVDESRGKAGKVFLRVVPYEGESYDIEASRKSGAEGAADVWTAEINMSKKLFGGDRLYVYVVGAEKRVIGDRETDIVYPVVDTGILFRKEFSPKVPQWFDMSQTEEETKKINIPFINSATQRPGVNSGLVSWDEDWWSDGTGYTLTINLGGGINSKSTGNWNQKWDQFKTRAKEAQKEKKSAELTKLGFASEESKEQNSRTYKSLKDQLAENEKEKKQQAYDSCDPKGKNVEKGWDVKGTCLIGLYFVKKGNEYKYSFGSLVFGFTLSVDWTKRSTLLFVPVYYNAGFVFQVDYLSAWSMDEGKEGISAGNFQNVKGNLMSTVLKSDGKTAGELKIGAKGYWAMGVGVKDVLSVRGGIDGTLQFGVKIPNPEKVTNGGRVEIGGSLKAELFITTLSIDIVRFKYSWGDWAGEDQFSWFGFVGDAPQSGDQLSEALLETSEQRSSELLRTDGNEEIRLEEKLAGTSDMSGFGKGFEESETALLGAGNEESLYASPVELLGDAADVPSVRTIQTTEDGSLFMVFLGNRGEEGGSTENGNTEALYYTSCPADTGEWTTPALLDPDGTFDTDPSVNMEGDVLTVTWSSAEEAFGENHSYLDKLSMLRTKAAAFRVQQDGSLTLLMEPVYLSGHLASSSIAKRKDADAYCDLNGETWYSGEKLYSTFTRYETEHLESIEEFTDLTKVKPRVYLAEYDTESGILMELRDLGLTGEKGLLMEADTEFLAVKGNQGSEDRSFLAVAYIQDTSGDLKTEEDNDLKLCLVETEREGSETFVYPSMDISEANGNSRYQEKEKEVFEGDTYSYISLGNDPDQDGIDGRSQLAAKIVETAGSSYLTFLKDGYLFDVIDLGYYLKEMFAEDCQAELYRKRAQETGGGLLASSQNEEAEESWYEIDTKDLNTAWEEAGKAPEQWKETAEEAGDTTLIEDENYEGTDPEEGKKRTVFENSPMEEVSSGILQTLETSFSGSNDGKLSVDKYEIVSDGDDLYVIYTDFPKGEITSERELFGVKLNLYDKTKQPEDTEEEIYFSEPVQLTDNSRVISDFTATMNDGVITIVSDSYDQVFPENGSLLIGANSIVITKYRPKGSLTLGDLSPRYAFVHDGTEGDKNGVSVSYQIANEGLEPQNGFRTWVEHEGTVIYEEESEETLLSGESIDCGFFWYPEGTGADETLTLKVAEKDGTVRATAELELEGYSYLKVSDYTILQTDSGYQAELTVENVGCLDTEAGELKLNLTDSEFKATKTYQTALIPALRAGESAQLTIDFQPLWSDFTENGTLNMEALLPGTTTGYSMTYVAGEPEMAVIEGDAEGVALRLGESRKLSVTAEPISEDTGNVVYSTDNPSIIDIDENGTVTARKTGIATVTAYLTRWGVSDDIQVLVTGQVEETESESPSETLPSYVELSGDWKQDANGNWIFTTRGGVKAADRWLAIARSTFGGGKGFEWFRFDKNGNMVTGWFKDSDDRMYYLQMVSDGNKGRMLTGWQKIDGKWYYFSQVSNGYKGEMLKNTTTPDGYTVGADGVWTGK